jgi:hypothetical protein
VLNLWKLFVECRLNTVIIVYRAVKFTSGKITSKREELLYAMRRDQEGCQCQGQKNIEAVERTVRENRRITVDDIAKALKISHGSVYSILL